MAASVDNAVDWIKIENSFNGKSYFWKVASAETMLSIPPEVARQVESGQVKLDIQEVDPAKDPGSDSSRQWQKVQDKDGRIYWWNLRTDETTWSLPVMGPAGQTGDENCRLRKNLETGNAVPGVKVIHGVDGLLQLDASAAPASRPTSTGSANPEPKPRRRFGFPRIGSKDEVKEKKDSSFKSGKKESTLDAVIRRRVKDGKGKLAIDDVVESMEMSSPFQVEHKVHVRFDQKGVRYSGLPSDWAQGDLAEKAVFGVNISSCPRLDVAGYVDRIPAVLVLLKQSVIDLNGYTSEGLFRLAPDKEECDMVKKKLNDCAGVEALKGVQDPQVPANLIKQFFREMQPNLLNCLDRESLSMFHQLSEVDVDKAGKKVDDIINEPAKSCLFWLLDLLAEVAQHSDVNRMTPKNLAIVFSPNLYDMADCEPMAALKLSQNLATLLENLLKWRIKECYENLKALPPSATAADSEELASPDVSTSETAEADSLTVVDRRASTASATSAASEASNFSELSDF